MVSAMKLAVKKLAVTKVALAKLAMTKLAVKKLAAPRPVTWTRRYEEGPIRGPSTPGNP
jgi:hypothetical protein